jgi:hypothetical protein
MKVSNKWKRMAEIYKRFSFMDGGIYQDLVNPEMQKIFDKYNSDRDYSDEAMLEAFERESTGKKHDIIRANGKINGYIEGKQWMDLTITEYWLPDLEERKTLFAYELYQEFPHWFLIKVLPQRYHLTEKEANELYENKDNHDS